MRFAGSAAGLLQVSLRQPASQCARTASLSIAADGYGDVDTENDKECGWQGCMLRCNDIAVSVDRQATLLVPSPLPPSFLPEPACFPAARFLYRSLPSSHAQSMAVPCCSVPQPLLPSRVCAREKSQCVHVCGWMDGEERGGRAQVRGCTVQRNAWAAWHVGIAPP